MLNTQKLLIKILQAQASQSITINSFQPVFDLYLGYWEPKKIEVLSCTITTRNTALTVHDCKIITSNIETTEINLHKQHFTVSTL